MPRSTGVSRMFYLSTAHVCAPSTPLAAVPVSLHMFIRAAVLRHVVTPEKSRPVRKRA